jgi:hypothetical protein
MPAISPCRFAFRHRCRRAAIAFEGQLFDIE